MTPNEPQWLVGEISTNRVGSVCKTTAKPANPEAELRSVAIGWSEGWPTRKPAAAGNSRQRCGIGEKQNGPKGPVFTVSRASFTSWAAGLMNPRFSVV